MYDCRVVYVFLCVLFSVVATDGILWKHFGGVIFFSRGMFVPRFGNFATVATVAELNCVLRDMTELQSVGVEGGRVAGKLE